MTAGSLPSKVLVVDDEPPIRRFLRTSLTAQGYEVVEAENAKDALGQLGRNRIDVIVLDLGLPDIDGLEILKHVRESGFDIPIIVLSSRTNETGEGQSARSRRRRLRHQALRNRGAPCPAARGAAPPPPAAWRAADLQERRSRRRPGAAYGYGPGARGETDAARIRSAAIAGRSCGEGADAQIHPARGVGLARRTCSICASTSGRCVRRSSLCPRRLNTS